VPPTGSYLIAFDLAPVGGGTEVTFHIDFPPMTGVMAIVVPILFPIVAKPEFRKRLELLKQCVEGTS
jgi:hypothetical protein